MKEFQSTFLIFIFFIFSCHLNEADIKKIERLSEEERYKEAIEFYFKNEEKFKKIPEILNEIGSCYFEIEEYEKAILFMEEAIALDPNEAIYYANKGLAQIENGDLLAGAISSETAIALDPENFSAYLSRSRVFIDMRKFELAIEDLDKCIKINEISKSELGLAYGNYASIYIHQKKFEKAKIFSDLAIEYNKEVYWAYTVRAYLQLKDQKIDEALETIEKGLSIKPKNGNLLHYKGLVFVKTGQKESGCQLMRESVINSENSKDSTFVENLIKEYCQY